MRLGLSALLLSSGLVASCTWSVPRPPPLVGPPLVAPKPTTDHPNDQNPPTHAPDPRDAPAKTTRSVLRGADSATLDIELRPRKDHVVLGEPIFVELIVQNRGSFDLFTLQGGDTINRYGRHDRYHVSVHDSSGAFLSDPLTKDEGFAGNSLSGLFPIPRAGKWSDELLLQDFADLRVDGRYVLSLKNDLLVATKRDGTVADKPISLPLELSIAVDVLPADSVELGRVIDEYGRTMGLGNDDFSDPTTRRSLWAMTRIADDRVVPYLAKAATTGTYTQKFTALVALSEFDDDRTLRTLIDALSDPDGNIRSAAASGLSKSKSPRAMESLWAARKAKSEAIRLTVVQALGARTDAKSTSRLVEMSNDRSASVSGEAKRYLRDR